MKGGHSWTTLKVLEKTFMIKNDSQILKLLIFDVSSNNYVSNICILNATIQHIFATKRFDAPLTNF